MKIIHLIDYFQPVLGYQETFLARYHQAFGHKVIIVTSDRYSPNVFTTSKNNNLLGKRIRESGYFIEENLRVWRLKVLFELPHCLWLRGFERKIREINPDLVIVHGIANLAAIRIALLKSRGGNFKLIYDEHATFYNSRSHLYPIFRLLFSRIIIKNADAFIAIVPESIDFMVKKYGIPEYSIQLIPLGADHNLFCFSEIARKSIRDELHITDSEIVFIYTGKIRPEKNLKILLDAFDYLIKKGICNIKLLIIGESPDSFIDEIKNYAHILKIDNYIIWHDLVLNKDLKNYYSAADIGVWPREASAGILEAMACNLPILVSDASRVTDLVTHDNGYVFKENLVSDLSSKMELLLKKDLRIKMGKNSRRIVEENFNWSRISQKFLKLVE